ncbi:hypothetical protein ACICHK_04660 [Streptomyces sp. AHU1]|uniref:hypothetical protein n=1 Tax=Streptomyces sp. AHU1 TaxID=3377215 RepID=UPI003877A29D
MRCAAGGSGGRDATRLVLKNASDGRDSAFTAFHVAVLGFAPSGGPPIKELVGMYRRFEVMLGARAQVDHGYGHHQFQGYVGNWRAAGCDYRTCVNL